MDLQCEGWMDALYAGEIEVCQLNEEKTELKDKLQALQDSWDQETTTHEEKLLECERHIYNLEQKYQQLVSEKEVACERGQVDGKRRFLESLEYTNVMKRTRLGGAQAQIEHLGGFKEGFDARQLDVYAPQNEDIVAPNEDGHSCQGR
ncbi:hypothetical protein CDL12_23655 [Handroanthus impetiginosus]|uniref:Uncharacterized protein n=1 Tax=Handroanthus impetiginosus TaxID=429701 RepID=A0A2G9GEX0_9LAMI|nr:hypothetical protein CDL12_23655 [Handroanthus impetiginosus]